MDWGSGSHPSQRLQSNRGHWAGDRNVVVDWEPGRTPGGLWGDGGHVVGSKQDNHRPRNIPPAWKTCLVSQLALTSSGDPFSYAV